MNKVILLIIFCFVAVLLIGNPPLHTNGQSLGVWNSKEPSPFKIPKKFEALLKDYRKNWVRLTNIEFSGLHWNNGVVVYINKNRKTFLHNHIGFLKIREDLLEDDEEEEDLFLVYPVGAILVKENYLLENGIPVAILTVTVMIKRQRGYDPKTGDWEFLQFDPKGKILVSGNSKNKRVEAVCASCHRNIVSRDFIFSTFYRTRPAEIIKLED